MTDQFEALRKYQTDHLILLVGTNPLPNYVAARLLCQPQGKVCLVSSTDTLEIAKRLQSKLLSKDTQTDIAVELKDMSPSGVYKSVSELVKSLKGSVGLNYTGGTKAMSVQAYRAVQEHHSDACFTYLDARTLSMMVDDPCHVRDERVDVALACLLTVEDMAGLHGIKFNKFSPAPVLPEVSKLLKEEFEGQRAWQNWAGQNLYKVENGQRKLKSSTDIRALPVPAGEFPGLVAEFDRLAGRNTARLGDWVESAGFCLNKDGIARFAEWLAGGYWLETIALLALQAIECECKLSDCGMNYVANNSKFEFDVAATRGFQLFALSCTTDASDDRCKQKLFEAYVRARQLGGDEARVALVCYHETPGQLLKKFQSDNFFDPHSVIVFGRPHLADLKSYLKNWINSARG